jgi:hypothetical protein
LSLCLPPYLRGVKIVGGSKHRISILVVSVSII